MQQIYVGVFKLSLHWTSLLKIGFRDFRYYDYSEFIYLSSDTFVASLNNVSQCCFVEVQLSTLHCMHPCLQFSVNKVQDPESFLFVSV